MMEEGKETISRREALKRMGGIVAGVAVASAGLPVLTASCTSGAPRRVILYFTATGNCLHVARELASEGTELLSIPQLVRQGRYEIEADEVGIVYPIYGHMPPNMVRAFMQKAVLKATYRFAVLTYGNRKCSAAEIWDQLTRKWGKPFDYIATVLMVDNWLPNFDMNQQIKIDKHVPEQLAPIREALARREKRIESVTDEERMQHQDFLQRSGVDPDAGFLLRSEKYFVVTDACIECAVCTEVCPRGNYKMTSGGVRTEGDCEFCFACIQNCPQKAIRFVRLPDDPLLANGEKNPDARYRNEHVSLWDIKASNRQ